MGELHMFPKPTQRRDAGAESRAAKAAALRRRIKDFPRLPRDAIGTAAEELHRLLESEEERERGFRARFCRDVLGSIDQSTKRLHGLAAKSARVGPKLPLRGTRYVEAADGLARMTGRDPDEVLLELFPALEEASGMATPQAEPSAEELRNQVWRLWLEGTDRIIRDLDLARVLRIVMRYPNKWPNSSAAPDFRLDFGDVVQPDEGDEGASLRGSGSAWSFITGRAPRLFLGECAAGTMDAIVKSGGDDEARLRPRPDLNSWARIYIRFWWAILPVGAKGEARGCFLASLSTERFPWVYKASEDEGNEEATAMFASRPWTSLIAPNHCRPDPSDWISEEYRSLRVNGVGLSWAAQLSTAQEDLDDPGPYTCTAQFDPETTEVIRQIFGADPAALGKNPLRILPPHEPWRSAILLAPDCGDTDWIGPDPDSRLSPRPPEPREADFPDEEAFSHAMQSWMEDARFADEREGNLRRRLPRHHEHYQAAVRAFPKVRRAASLGLKLELSLCDLPAELRPDLALRAQAAALRSHCDLVMSRNLAQTQARLTHLAEVIGREP
jgi:hypothetical protein